MRDIKLELAPPREFVRLLAKLIDRRSGGQAQVALDAGITPGALNQFLRGDGDKKTKHLPAILRAMKLAPDERIALHLALDRPMREHLGLVQDDAIGVVLDSLDEVAGYGHDALMEFAKQVARLARGFRPQ